LYFADKEKAIDFFGFQKEVPVILIIGGGTGSQVMNSLVLHSLDHLVKFCQIIHSTGWGRTETEARHSRYRRYEFIDRNTMKMAYAAADLVVSRAGMSTITELAYLGKAAALIPIPRSHQELNAYELGKYNACEILNQNELDPGAFAQIIEDLLRDKSLLHSLSSNIQKVMPKDATERVIKEIVEII
ncbi:MAG: UDP-N-acetylglucosamine-N-acetylmuramyl-(pentapeptide) pyrophosphoryl-undecaprenol N-acetylglucosamine transferase, partial [Candidatus Berkelbacteria bacterium Licking1014_85]